MIKHAISICFLFFGFQSFAQFKYVPKDLSDAPEWALRMYAEDANMYEVEDLRAAYYQEHAYQKDIHERNFQHWITQVGRLVDDRGEIRSAEYWNSGGAERGGNAIWEPIGPMETYNLGSEGGFPVSWQSNAYCMDACEDNSNIVVAGIEGGELFKSTDKGLTWTAMTEGLPVATPNAVRIAPSDCNTIYFFANGSLYKTTDGGSNWTDANSFGGGVYEIEVHPTDPNTLFVCGSGGVHKSVDGGTNFQSIYTGTCWDVKYHPSNASIVYLLKSNSTGNKCEFFKSTDGGDSFSVQTNGWYSPAVLAEAEDIGAKIGLSAAAADQIYVALIGASKADDNGWIGVYKSTDAGITWTNPSGQDGGPYDEVNHPNVATINPNGTGFHQGFYNFAMGVSQTDPNRLWVGCLSLSLSTDGGVNYERIGGYSVGPNNIGWIHPDVQDIVTVGNDVWVATDGGINYSSDDLASHESRKFGIYNSTFWGYNQGWNQDIMVGGRYHNGNTGYFENYPEGDHLRLGGAESPTGYVNPLLERKVYFSDITDHYLPENFGDPKVNTANMGLYPTEGYWTSESSEVEFDPRYAGHLYLGRENKIYKSTNEGAIFEALDNWGVNSIVYELEVCRQNPERLYTVVRTNGAARMYYSTDGGNDWTMSPVDPGNSGKMEISVNPANDDEVWGIEVNSSSVFRTTDGGASWEDMNTATLSGHQLRDVVVQGGTDIVYIASNTSVFYWNSNTSDWEDIGAGLPARMDVLEMRIFYKESLLRLCDKGKGIWEANLVATSLPIAQPVALNDVVYCSRDTVQFDCYSIIDHNGASWSWSFTPQPQHVSATDVRNPRVVLGTNGEFMATLTVTDGSGNTSTNDITVEVNSNCNVDTVPGMALECFGSGSDYSSTPDFGLTTNTFTITAWVKPDGVQPDYTGIVMNNGTSGGINFRPGNALAYHWPGGQWWWDSGLIVPDGEWSYVAMVVTPNDVAVYLNGVGATHTITTDMLDVTSMFMGSYQGWGGRNYTGQIDEVRIWNRSLSQDEIRELRHITLTQEMMDADPDLLAYYQFNELEGGILDRKGINHASLVGGAVRESSDGPFGKGDVDRISITGVGAHAFADCQSSIEFEAGAGLPDGEVVLSRLHVLPNELPSPAINFGGYFVLNNYGSNPTFDAESFSLTPYQYSQPPSSWDVFLHSRTENEYLSNWMEGCTASTVGVGEVIFATNCAISQAGQFFPVSDQFSNINQTDQEQNLNVYPNPVVKNGVVMVENESESEVRFSVYNAKGKLIRSEKISNGHTFQFQPKEAGGVYTYSVLGDDFIINGKLVVVN